jgi:hypothetical protein
VSTEARRKISTLLFIEMSQKVCQKEKQAITHLKYSLCTIQHLPSLEYHTHQLRKNCTFCEHPEHQQGHTSQPNDTHLPTNVKKSLLVHIHCCCILWRTTNTCYKGKLKKSLVLTPWGVYNSTLGLDRVELLTSRPSPFTFGEGVTRTHCIGGWAEPTESA